MDIDKIKELCLIIKNSIDWEYDTYSGYQKMMDDIDDSVDKILEEIKE